MWHDTLYGDNPIASRQSSKGNMELLGITSTFWAEIKYHECIACFKSLRNEIWHQRQTGRWGKSFSLPLSSRNSAKIVSTRFNVLQLGICGFLCFSEHTECIFLNIIKRTTFQWRCDSLSN